MKCEYQNVKTKNNKDQRHNNTKLKNEIGHFKVL